MPIERDGVLGYKLHARRLWHGVKIYWHHPERYKSKRRLSLCFWFVWTGPKYHLQARFPLYDKRVGGMTNTIKLKRPFFEIFESGVFLAIMTMLAAIISQ